MPNVKHSFNEKTRAIGVDALVLIVDIRILFVNLLHKVNGSEATSPPLSKGNLGRLSISDIVCELFHKQYLAVFR